VGNDWPNLLSAFQPTIVVSLTGTVQSSSSSGAQQLTGTMKRGVSTLLSSLSCRAARVPAAAPPGAIAASWKAPAVQQPPSAAPDPPDPRASSCSNLPSQQGLQLVDFFGECAPAATSTHSSPAAQCAAPPEPAVRQSTSTGAGSLQRLCGIHGRISWG
jgi:hypothetical protein